MKPQIRARLEADLATQRARAGVVERVAQGAQAIARGVGDRAQMVGDAIRCLALFLAALRRERQERRREHAAAQALGRQAPPRWGASLQDQKILKGGERLYEAARAAGPRTVAALPRAGGGPAAGNAAAQAAFRKAISSGSMEAVWTLLECDLVVDGHCAIVLLEEAVRHGDSKLVGELLRRGVDPNAPHAGGALVAAAELGRGDIVELLLDRGAEPTTENRFGVTALSVARDPHSPTPSHIRTRLEQCMALRERDELDAALAPRAHPHSDRHAQAGAPEPRRRPRL